MTHRNPVPAQDARYDTDPAALAWARTKVQHQLDRLAKFEEQATQTGKTDLAHGLSMARRSTAQLLLGGEGCVVGAFDARRPAMFGGQPADDAAREEQQDRAITARAHKAGDHQWCDVTCEAAMPTEVLRNTILYRAIPGSKGALAELERRAAQAIPPALSNNDRTFLKFALDLAFDEMANNSLGFVADDHTALANLRRLADNEQPAGEPTAKEAQARRDAQDAAATLRQAADLAHAEGVRLYDDMGQKAAEGAWAARDRLRARADEISGHGAQTGDGERPEPPMRQAVNALAAQLHDEDPAVPHGTGGPGGCLRCAAAYVPPAHFTRDDGTACCVHTTPVGPGSCAACWDLVKWGTAGGEQQ